MEKKEKKVLVKPIKDNKNTEIVKIYAGSYPEYGCKTC